jgi:hypothetical protein
MRWHRDIVRRRRARVSRCHRSGRPPVHRNVRSVVLRLGRVPAAGVRIVRLSCASTKTSVTPADRTEPLTQAALLRPLPTALPTGTISGFGGVTIHLPATVGLIETRPAAEAARSRYWEVERGVSGGRLAAASAMSASREPGTPGPGRSGTPAEGRSSRSAPAGQVRSRSGAASPPGPRPGRGKGRPCAGRDRQPGKRPACRACYTPVASASTASGDVSASRRGSHGAMTIAAVPSRPGRMPSPALPGQH